MFCQNVATMVKQTYTDVIDRNVLDQREYKTCIFGDIAVLADVPTDEQIAESGCPDPNHVVMCRSPPTTVGGHTQVGVALNVHHFVIAPTTFFVFQPPDYSYMTPLGDLLCMSS